MSDAAQPVVHQQTSLSSSAEAASQNGHGKSTLISTLQNLETAPGAYTNPLINLSEENPGYHQQMTHNFGTAAVDIELLEKEIAAKEQRRREQQFVDLTGEIAGQTSSRRFGTQPNLNNEFDTLDEPVWDTINRDLRTIGAKFGQVLVPKDNQQLLRNWDLWGPLFICVFISVLLQGGKSGKGPHFTEVFTLTFFGSCVITMNTKLLGGTISFFQSLCVLGYCLLPPGMAALICKFLEFSEQTSLIFGLRLIVTAAGFVWATYASMAFLSGSLPQKRKILAVYPMFLFFFVVSWIIMSHSNF